MRCRAIFKMLEKSLNLMLVGMAPLFFFVSPAQAADHYNLEEGLPTQVVDSLPTPYLNREIQGAFRWDHTEAGKEEFEPEARLEYGFARNWQAELSVPFQFGDGVEDDGIGDVELSALYNFNQESPAFPGIAVEGAVAFPTSDEGKGLDTTLKFVATKTLGADWRRAHLNLAWKHNDEERSDEREDRYVAIIGYDCRVAADMLLVLDLIREQTVIENEEFNILEAGVRYQFTPLTVLAAGIGAGFGDDSPDARVVVGVQHSF